MWENTNLRYDDIAEECTIGSFQEAISTLKELQKYAAQMNCPDMLAALVRAEDAAQKHSIQLLSKQSNLRNYLNV